MDGENAWEYYDKNGLPFLSSLFGTLQSEQIETFTLGRAVNEFSCSELNKFIPSSWIDIGFPLWIGSVTKNKSWDILSSIRSLIDDEKLENELLRRSLYAAEGSDWNWWYDTYYNETASLNFDKLYRLYLKRVVEEGAIPLMEKIEQPLQELDHSIFYRNKVNFISPLKNGKEANFYEWIYAGFLDTSNISGTMKETDLNIKKIFFGYDLLNLYIRIDFLKKNFNRAVVNIVQSEEICFSFDLDKGIGYCNDREINELEVAIDEILEIKIPFDLINANENENFMMNIMLKDNERILEVQPTFSYINIIRPGKDFQLRNWRV